MSPTINHKPGSGAVAEDERPPRAGLILGVLILGAVVANINLGIANVALPSIGAGLDTTQAQLNLVALGFTLGLAASVLYLGALADRYGRKLAMLAGATLSIPAACLAAWAPNPQVLVGARVFGGVAAGMLYPTTLSLISALFKGGARTRSIALWSGIGGGVSALGPLIGGLLLGRAWWGSVFLVTIPLAVLVVIFGLLWIPRHAGETVGRVDNPGGVLSVIFVGPLVLGIGLVPNYGFNATVLGLFGLCVFTSPVHPPRASGQEPSVRTADSQDPDVLDSPGWRHNRLGRASGLTVHRSAVHRPGRQGGFNGGTVLMAGISAGIGAEGCDRRV